MWGDVTRITESVQEVLADLKIFHEVMKTTFYLGIPYWYGRKVRIEYNKANCKSVLEYPSYVALDFVWVFAGLLKDIDFCSFWGWENC